MKRSLWVALLIGGAGWNASGQDAAESPPAGTGFGTETPAADVGQPGLDAAEPDLNAVEPAVDLSAPVVPDAVAPGQEPAGDTDAVRPGEPLEGAEPLEPGLPGSPPESRPIDPDAPPTPNADPLPDTILDATLVPENDLPPSEAANLPGADAQNADGLGAPLVEDGTLPEARDDVPAPGVIDPRLPIERQPLLDDPAVEPLPTEPDVFPPARRQPPVIDPAYSAPAPPRPRPQIEIDEVVRNPIRIYETRLLVLMGHNVACEQPLEILARRFPTDARVPYLRFFHLSRTGQHDAALDALRQAVEMERLYPVTDYNRFMEPLQGPDRYYLERVRRASAELAAADSLVEPVPEDVLPEDLRGEPADVDADEPPLPAEPRPATNPPAGPPEILDEPAPESVPNADAPPPANGFDVAPGT